jgi:hypothetical protein
MKPGRLFWGAFFLVLGILLIADRTAALMIPWYAWWRFWPLLLVLGGIALLLRGSKFLWIVVALAGAAAALVAASMLSFSWNGGDWQDNREAHVQEFMVPLEAATERASFRFESGAGVCMLQDTTNVLVAANTECNFGEYRLEQSAAGSQQDVRLWLEGRHGGWNLGRMGNRAEVRLNTVPVWDLDFSLGATRVDIDLRPYAVEHLRVKSGAAKVTLKIGPRGSETRVDVQAGASSIRIEVPESAGCELFAEAPLSSKKFPGFTKIGTGEYRTDNYDSAAQKISITMKAGVSSMRVTRY